MTSCVSLIDSSLICQSFFTALTFFSGWDTPTLLGRGVPMSATKIPWLRCPNNYSSHLNGFLRVWTEKTQPLGGGKSQGLLRRCIDSGSASVNEGDNFPSGDRPFASRTAPWKARKFHPAVSPSVCGIKYKTITSAVDIAIVVSNSQEWKFPKFFNPIR
jgi:hypothetical protein